MAGPKIPGHEVCEALRKAISGQLVVELGMPLVTWDEGYVAGNHYPRDGESRRDF